MTPWSTVEEEEVDVRYYHGVRNGLVATCGCTEQGEMMYELTDLGMARARAGALEYGYAPDDLDEAALTSFALALQEVVA